jgi:hypothetical protein
MKRHLALLLGLVGLAACAAPSKAQRVQEGAYELNMTSRFGRTEGVLDKVAKEEREKFLMRHRRWHGQIRIVDLELAGMGFPSSDEADVFVTVGWQPADGADMRSTTVRQRWKDKRGTWVLINEERAQGDSGLFGEAPASPPGVAGDSAEPAPSRAAQGEAQFRTTVIR